MSLLFCLLLQKSVPTANDKCQFYFWFHTTFIENNKLVILGRAIASNNQLRSTFQSGVMSVKGKL